MESMQTRNRYSIRQSSPNSYMVIDNEHERWGLPEKAVTLFLRETDALHIAESLNKAWIKFLRNPE